MNIAPIAELIQIGPAHTKGMLHIQLNEEVRRRYARYGSEQDSYEFVIDTGAALRVKRANKDGKLMSWLERLRYGPFARFALVANQPAITSLLPALMPLNDDQVSNPAAWRLLTYDLEWKIESAERFYRHFLRERAQVSTFDMIATIADVIRAEILHYLHYLCNDAAANAVVSQPDPVAQAILDAQFIAQINQRIAETGITLRRFYRSQTVEAQAIVDRLLNLRQADHLPPGPADDAAPIHVALISGLLSHLCQDLNPNKRWLEQIWRVGGFDITFDEMQSALTSATPTSTQAVSPVASRARSRRGCQRHQRIAQELSCLRLTPISVVQRLKDAGRTQLRAANRTTPQERQHRSQLRQKALAFCELALLLSASPFLPVQASSAQQNLRIELLALIHSLREPEQQRKAQIAFRPGSAVHLMAVTAESAVAPDHATASDEGAVRLVQEILPLAIAHHVDAHEPLAVWTPAAAAKQVAFNGAAPEFDLMLQVLAPNAAAGPDSEALAAVLFWTWKVRASREQFSLHLRPTNMPMLYDIELHDAEFIDPQPTRSTSFPTVPHLRLRYEPLELALLIDGYWLADNAPGVDKRHSGLKLLNKLLDGLDEIENLTKRGLLLHAVICLDEHIAETFRLAYGSLPSLYTLGDAPIETTAQLLAEWLHPWVERWNAWAIKPYPIDTDIALEKGFRYLRQLQWRQTTHPMQRAIVVVGRSRPHDHAQYFVQMADQEPLYPQHVLDRLDIPYHPQDRFSVTDIDWREDLRSLRDHTGAILALCDPGLPNPHYRLSTNHVLYREYQEFWATIDPGTLLDIDDQSLTQCAAMGVDRVLQILETQLFQRRAVRCCEPPLTLPFSQFLTASALPPNAG